MTTIWRLHSPFGDHQREGSSEFLESFLPHLPTFATRITIPLSEWLVSWQESRIGIPSFHPLIRSLSLSLSSSDVKGKVDKFFLRSSSASNTSVSLLLQFYFSLSCLHPNGNLYLSHHSVPRFDVFSAYRRPVFLWSKSSSPEGAKAISCSALLRKINQSGIRQLRLEWDSSPSWKFSPRIPRLHYFLTKSFCKRTCEN